MFEDERIVDSPHNPLAALRWWLDSTRHKGLAALAVVVIGLAAGADCGMCGLLLLVKNVPGLAIGRSAAPQPVAVVSPAATSVLALAGTPSATATGRPAPTGTPELAGTPPTPWPAMTASSTPTREPRRTPQPAAEPVAYYAAGDWPGPPGEPGTVELPPAQTDPQTLDKAERFYEQGKAAFDALQWQEAIAGFAQALALDPRHAEAYLYRGVASRRIGSANADLGAYLASQDRSIADFSYSIAADASAWGAYNERGASYESRALAEPLRDDRRAWQELALADYVRASELDPAQPAPWLNRARVHISLGQCDQALKELKKSQPWTPTTVCIAAAAYSGLGAQGDALSSIEQAIAADPADPALYMQRARIYLASGEYAKALDDANTAADFWRGLFVGGEVWYLKAAAEYYLGHYDLVEEYIEMGKGFTWTDWGEPYYYLGMVYNEQGKTQEAIEALDWAEQTLDGDDPLLAETRAELAKLQ